MSGIIAMLMAGAAAGAGSLGVTASPPDLSSGSYSPPTFFTTNQVSGIVSGGSGSFTYLWTFDTYDSAYGWTINSPTSLSTDFTITRIHSGDTPSAIARLTVTDTAGGPPVFVTVFVVHTNLN